MAPQHPLTCFTMFMRFPTSLRPDTVTNIVHTSVYFRRYSDICKLNRVADDTRSQLSKLIVIPVELPLQHIASFPHNDEATARRREN